MKTVDLKDSCSVGGGPAMNMIIMRVPVLNRPEDGSTAHIFGDQFQIVRSTSSTLN